MVTILERKQPTLGEQIGGGLGRGIESGMGAVAQYALQQKGKTDERAHKLAGLDKLKQTDYWKNASETEKALIESEATGQISAQLAKSLTNLYREQQGHQRFGEALAGMDEDNAPIGMESGEPPTTADVPGSTERLKEPSQKSKRNFDSEIAKWQRTLGTATNPGDKEFAKSKINELQSLRDQEQKQKKAGQEQSYKRNEKYLHRLDESKASNRKRQLALNQIGAALQTGNFESFRNRIGQFTGLDFLKDASAQTVNTASKEFLVGSLSEITGRPNMFLEQAISKAMVNPLYQKEANQIIYEGFQLLQSLGEKEHKIADDLEEFYTQDGGEIPRNFQKLVQQEVDKFAEPAIEAYQERINKLLSQEDKLSGQMVDVIGPDGVEWEIDESQVGDLPEGFRLK